MKNDEVSPSQQSDSSRVTQDAAVDELRRSQQVVRSLRARLANAEAALTRSQSTSENIRIRTEASDQRRNINDAVREALITSLQSDHKDLLLRIDKDVLELANADERSRALSTELILAHEQEQRRIAREMHDELGQDLTALKLLIARTKNADANETKRLLDEAGQVAEALLQTVRDICARLRPQVLDDLGLIAGLSVHLKNFGTRSGLAIEFEHSAIDETRLSPIMKSVVFRVIQEAVTNVARHAKTEHARVKMAMDAEQLEFVVEDRGCGFDVQRVKEAPSTGLSSMAERVLLVNGVCEILSATKGGTTVTARIPLKMEESPSLML